MAHFCQPPMIGVGSFTDLPEHLPSNGGPAILETSESTQRTIVTDPRPTVVRAEPNKLVEWIEEQAAAFKSQDTQAGQWMAETLLELAATARFLGAKTPEQLELVNKRWSGTIFRFGPVPR